MKRQRITEPEIAELDLMTRDLTLLENRVKERRERIKSVVGPGVHRVGRFELSISERHRETANIKDLREAMGRKADRFIRAVSYLAMQIKTK